MLLTKRLRAGILLYALFMASVFALLLQFYVSRVQATARLQEAQYQQATASLMAELTKESVNQESGSYTFTTGKTNYDRRGDTLTVTVQLKSGQTYRYDFLVKSKSVADGQDKQEKTELRGELVAEGEGKSPLTGETQPLDGSAVLSDAEGQTPHKDDKNIPAGT